MSVGDLDLGAVREFLGQYDAQAADLDLPAAAAEELAAEIDTIKAQIRSPRPKHHIIRESLRCIRAILESASGGVAAVGLLDLLQHIHLVTSPGWPCTAVGAEMGAPIRRQLRLDGVRRRDRGLTQIL